MLPYTDILFCNELELKFLTGLLVEKDNKEFESQMLWLKSKGFTGALVLHTHAWAAYVDESATYHQPSLQIPSDLIKSNSGAGDAFAAGFLLQYLNGATPPEALKSATYTAASCLLALTCSDGVIPYDQALATFNNISFYND